MSHDLPALTVLMPVHNGARYLRAALESIRGQTFGDFEFIIVDDGSTDGTTRLLERSARRDPRLRLLRRAHSGVVDALNVGLANARAPLVARMDADDIAHPERLERQADFLHANPEFVACGSAVHLIDRHGGIVDELSRPSDPRTIDDALMHGDANAVIHPALMVRRQVLEQVGGYRKFAQFAEDLDLSLRLSELGPLTNLEQPLLDYRVHFESTNFRRGDARAAATETVLRDACRRRGINFDPSVVDESDATKSPVRFHQEWAQSALRLGHGTTALKHALLATSLAPTDRTSYSTLRTVVDRLLHRHRPIA